MKIRKFRSRDWSKVYPDKKDWREERKEVLDYLITNYPEMTLKDLAERVGFKRKNWQDLQNWMKKWCIDIYNKYNNKGYRALDPIETKLRLDKIMECGYPKWGAVTNAAKRLAMDRVNLFKWLQYKFGKDKWRVELDHYKKHSWEANRSKGLDSNQ